jgi:hypothetical protein
MKIEEMVSIYRACKKPNDKVQGEWKGCKKCPLWLNTCWLVPKNGQICQIFIELEAGHQPIPV